MKTGRGAAAPRVLALPVAPSGARRWLRAGVYLALGGSIRVLIEIVRVDVRVLGLLSVGHVALMAMALGSAFIVRTRGELV